MEILEKPRLRGVFHQYAFYVALVAGVGSGRTITVSATWMISSTGRPDAAACALMAGSTLPPRGR